MTVPSNQPNRYSYVGDGIVTTFAFNSVFENAADLLVYLWDTVNLVATLQVLNSDYTVTGGSGSTGSVVFGAAPSTTSIVILVGNPAVVQSLNVVPDGAFPAETFEDGIDYLTLLVRRCEGLLSRSMSQPDWDYSSFSPTLPFPRSPGDMFAVNAAGTGFAGGFPTAAQRANMFLAFDSSGLPVAATPVTTAAIATALGLLMLQATPLTVAHANSPITAVANNRFIFADSSAGAVVINLPAVSTLLPGTVIEVVKLNSGGSFVSVVPNGTDNFLGGNVTQNISGQWSSLRCLCVGTGGWIN